MLSEERVTAIKQILVHHVGKKNAISSREIATQLKIPDNDTFGHTRSLIMRIIKTDNLPIGAYDNGYFMIETKEELEEEIAKFSKRIDSLRTRIKKIKTNYESFHGSSYVG